MFVVLSRVSTRNAVPIAEVQIDYNDYNFPRFMPPDYKKSLVSMIALDSAGADISKSGHRGWVSKDQGSKLTGGYERTRGWIIFSSLSLKLPKKEILTLSSDSL